MATDNNAATPPAKSKAQILVDVYTLATQFSTCVEAFNLIHPSKDNDHAQKVALAKLGLQQGRLLIFGDAVGISSPPATIATHMIPSHPGLTNPDPHLPVNFGVRDSRLDDDAVTKKIRKALDEIAGRPDHMSREELMEKYGLKPPKHTTKFLYPPLDHNRLEAFREKYDLLQDLVLQTAARIPLKRHTSAVSHWTVKDSARFEKFVKTVRDEVDALIDLVGVKEQVDRGTRSDIRCMAWHPELTGPIIQKEWEKLRLIREACEVDYPEYIEVVDTALQYLHEEIKESSLATHRAAIQAKASASAESAAGARRKSDYELPPTVATTPAALEPEKTAIQIACENALNPKANKEKRPGWLSAFKFKSWSKSHKKEKTQRSNSLPDTSVDPQRSLSEGKVSTPDVDNEDGNTLTPVRSKSLSAIPDDAPLDLDSRMQNLNVNEKRELSAIQENGVSTAHDVSRHSLDKNALVQTQTVSSEGSNDNHLTGATTVNSLIDRHDMYQGMGRIQTKDIRRVAHEF